MKRFLVLATLSGLFCGIGLLSLSRAQAPAENVAQDAVPAAQAQYGPTVQVERDTATGKIIRTYAVPGVGPGMSARGEIAQLVNQLRDATDEGKKGELTKKLEAAVAKHFDEDMKAREAELAKLEERLKKLKDQLERRRKAKADILQLELKVLVNEAEGLGFSAGSFFDHGGMGGYGAGGSFLPSLTPNFPPAAKAPPATKVPN